MADFLKQKSGIEAEIDSGGRIGEFSVWVDEKLVAEKGSLKFPDREKILAAVKQEM